MGPFNNPGLLKWPHGQFVYVFFMQDYSSFIWSMRGVLAKTGLNGLLRYCVNKHGPGIRSSAKAFVCFPCGIRGQLLNPQVNFAWKREKKMDKYYQQSLVGKKRVSSLSLSLTALPDIGCLGRFQKWPTCLFIFPMPTANSNISLRRKDPCVSGPVWLKSAHEEKGGKEAV